MRNKTGCFALGVWVTILAFLGAGFGAAVSSTPPGVTPPVKTSVHESAATKRKLRRRRHHRRYRYYTHYRTSSFATDSTAGDITAGEDPVVRQAAIDALGNMNGTIVAIDPLSGRILSMVNQKLALASGAQPCSTIKVAVALAALSEGVVAEDTEVRLSRRSRLNLTEALAHSNNAYFENVGRKLGFEKVSHYAHLFGLGEMAGYDIEGEHLGAFPSRAPASRLGGVGKLCSFGENISMTPLQLGALVAAVANGGTLYYLQHPETAEEAASFTPRIKRKLNIEPEIPELSDGMAGAVEYGTARSVLASFSEEPVLGKTGTCSRAGTRFGWFASFANTQFGKIVVVVFLQGGYSTYGPRAAEIAGHAYRNLYDHSFFAEKKTEVESKNDTTPAPAATPQ